MHWVAGLHEIRDEGVDSVLLQANAHLEHVVCVRSGFVLPSARDLYPCMLLGDVVPALNERLC